ncbi:MAG: protein translocase subunit SecD, partial [Chromatiales bacterium]|nr:protein translocase subunit SecD [Chromatiales bacterium]
MINRYPLWKNLLVLLVVLLGIIYALPNVFDQNPSMEITGNRGTQVTEATLTQALDALQAKNLAVESSELIGSKMLLRFADSETQLRAKEILELTLGGNYTQALTLSTDVPGWLRGMGALPMYLGLDLRGGIHVLIDVDMDAAVEQSMERYTGDIRAKLRSERLRYSRVSQNGDAVVASFKRVADRDNAVEVLGNEFRDLLIESSDDNGEFQVVAKMGRNEQLAVKKFALDQNITTLRNRVNVLGVSEPIIQQQGERRIVVQLPGAADPARLKNILSATATLEYRLVDEQGNVEDALAGKVPIGSKLYETREGQPILLKKRVIVTGNQITDASSGFDQRSSQPAVFVSLDGQGARRMRDVTTENVGKPMAVVFIETRTETKIVDGEKVVRKIPVEEVISVANILEPFGSRFQTTGVDSPEEARD